MKLCNRAHLKLKIPWEMAYGNETRSRVPPCTDISAELLVKEILEELEGDDEDLEEGVYYETLEQGNCDPKNGGGMFFKLDKTFTYHVEYVMYVIKDGGEEIPIGKVPFDDDDYPFRFKSGEEHAITGWDLMFVNMCLGEKRRAVVPHTHGFSGNKVPDFIRDTVSPFDELIYIYRLLDIDESITTAEEVQYQHQQDTGEQAGGQADDAAAGFGEL